MTADGTKDGGLCEHGYWQHSPPNTAGTCTHYTMWPSFPEAGPKWIGSPPTLGVLQEMWDAWSPVIGHTMTLAPEDFFGLLATQAGEIDSHLCNDMGDKAINEVVDIVSIALNWLRNLGVDTPDRAAQVIQDRVRNRYKGKVHDIIARDFPGQFGPHDA